MSERYKGKSKIKEVIESTGISGPSFATASKMSVETLRRIKNGEPVTGVKAHGIVRGLKENGVEVTLEEIFEKIIKDKK